MSLSRMLLVVLGIVGCTAKSDDTGGTTVGESSSGAATTSSSSSTTAADTSSSSSTSTSESSTGLDGSSEGSSSESSTGPAGPVQVQFETTLGVFVVELDDVAAPITVANFLTYLDGGFYDGIDGQGATIFHRVIPEFVVQGGGLTEALETKNTLPPIVNESGNGLTNLRGTIAMARTSEPDTATSQFFVNLIDNDFLDDPPGYAVFGHVVTGMDVIDAMAEQPTQSVGDFDDVPVEPIVVLSATRL
ncbi:MAG TPA: peptidylprolyl isomerase [Nannocystaceae bacterium]|nr:peptidylprolyl isomerase [Nannocystaceae bacterium]